ncbi:MAG: lipopolysaccharide heptosyltransferase II [Candidatus Omnitrophota bacterium]
MKVLQILPSLEVGGVERGVIDLVRAMKERGEGVVVVSSGGRLVTELQRIGVTHYTLPVHQKSLLALSLVGRLARIIREEGVDIVHARSRVPAWIAWLAARRTSAMFLTTCHGYYSNHGFSRIMGWGKRVIVPSTVIGRHMIEDFGVPTEHIRLIPRGVDLAEFRFHSRSPRKDGVFRIINVGRLTPIKGHLEFLRAVHLLRAKLPKIEVRIVGAEGKGKTKYTQEIQKTIRQLGLENCVEMLGTRRDIAELIAESDLLVLPTLVPEAFGRVVVEAGAVGTPVLATRIGGVLDIIEHGRDGHLVAPGDIDGMAEGMATVLSDPELQARFSGNLRKKIEEKFTLDQMIARTLEVYRELRARKKILVIKLGAAGDLILGTPSFRMLRRRYPHASISLLVDKKLAPLVSHCPHLDEILPLERGRLSRLAYLFKMAKTLRKEKFEVSVDLQNTKWTHLLTFLSGVPDRYGFRRGKFGFLVNHHDKNYETVESPVKNQYRILSKMGVPILDETLELWPDPAAEKKIDAILAELSGGPGVKWAGFAVGSSSHWKTKRWPAEHFHRLAGELVRQGYRIVLLGTEQDRPCAEALRTLDSGIYEDQVGRTSLPELVSWIKRLRVLIAGDTAPLHIAAAVKTPFVGLFGPTDLNRHAPPSKKGVVISKHLPCQPCYRGVCRIEDSLACLRKITPEEVLEAIHKLGVG